MFAGIDVSKDDLEAQLDSQAEEMSCSNTAAGFSRLIRWLKSHHVSRVVLEATGGYERQVMKALQAADLEVVRINPSRARSFARALGLQAKTDPIDAKLLAHFAATIKPPKASLLALNKTTYEPWCTSARTLFSSEATMSVVSKRPLLMLLKTC